MHGLTLASPAIAAAELELAKALEMPESGARYQQLDRAAACYAKAELEKPEDLTIRTCYLITTYLATGRAKEQIASVQRLAFKLAAMAESSDSFDALHARAVVSLITGNFDVALESYRALQGSKDVDFLAKARHFARHMARSAGLVKDHFDKAFPPLRLIVFSGHLPPRADTACRENIESQLEELGAEIGVSSAAAGSDLLFLDCLKARRGEFHLILPWSKDTFRETSVRSYGGTWESTFDAVLAGAASIREIGEFAEPDSSVARQYLMEVSAGIAVGIARQRHLDIVPVAVWDGKPGEVGGTAAFCDFWKRQLGIEPRVITPPVESSSTAFVVTKAFSSGRAQNKITQQSVKSMLFIDVVGFSKLPEAVMPQFIEHFLGRVSLVIAKSKHAPHTVNTWGDALYAVFDYVKDAGLFALELNEMVEGSAAEWEQLGLGKLRIRTGLHAGPVFLHQDPIVRRLGFSGAHVNRAARIEPVADHGGILASEEFAALAMITPGIGFSVTFSRKGRLYKDYPGEHRLYSVLRDRSADLLLLAKAIHDDYCEKARGYGDTPETNSAIVPWESLPLSLQSANLAQAEDIPYKLKALGYEIVEAGGIRASQIKLNPELVEPLSVIEHDRWMTEKLRAGWVYAPIRDNVKLHHPLLVPYEDLPEREKEKDRDTVRNIPNLLSKANCLVKSL